MNGSLLAKAICASLEVTDPVAAAQWEKIASAIVTHIQTTAVVSGGVCTPNGPIAGAMIQ